MKPVVKSIFWFLTGFFLLTFFFLLISRLPERHISLETQSSSEISGSLKVESISDFFKNLFKPSEVSILILGKPGSGYQGEDLADALVLAHFNPEKNKLFLISLPRDLWVADDQEQYKLNEIIHKKKLPQALEKIEEITGLKPNGYLVVDLKMVREMIDFLGGVDIVLEEAAVDWVTNFVMKAGHQHLSGEDAVWLIRNRYNPQGDFFREKNQQKIIKSAFEKFLSLNTNQKEEFLKKFILNPSFLANAQLDFSSISSYLFNYSFMDKVSLESVVLDFSTKLFKTHEIPLSFATATIHISTLIPSAGFEDYSQIKKYIQERLK